VGTGGVELERGDEVGKAGVIDEAGEEAGDAGVRGDEAPRTDPGLEDPPVAGVDGVDDGALADPRGSRPRPSPAGPSACGGGTVSRATSDVRCTSTVGDPVTATAAWVPLTASTMLAKTRWAASGARGDAATAGARGSVSTMSSSPRASPRPRGCGP
jgi:hypothetical protein